MPASYSDTALQIHTKFRIEVETSSPLTRTHKKASTELEAIEGTFPNLQDPVIAASMAAWLYFLCLVDDLVEEMNADAGVSILNEIIILLKGSRRSSFDLGILGRPVPTAKGKNHTQSKSSYSCDTVFEYEIRHVTSCFRLHLMALLPCATYEGFCDDIGNVFEAMAKEIGFRRYQKGDISEYMRIRESTIGLTPFFNLLRVSQKYSSQGSSGSLALLELCVNVVVGLQNDLIGLEKDIATREWMNYAIVDVGYRGDMEQREALQLVKPGVQRAVESHNCTVRLAVKYWEELVVEGNVQDIQIALSMLVFIDRHLQWALTSKRYKA